MKNVRLDPRTRIHRYTVNEDLVLTRQPQPVYADDLRKLEGLMYNGVPLVVIEGESDEGEPEVIDETPTSDDNESEDESQ